MWSRYENKHGHHGKFLILISWNFFIFSSESTKTNELLLLYDWCMESSQQIFLILCRLTTNITAIGSPCFVHCIYKPGERYRLLKVSCYISQHQCLSQLNMQHAILKPAHGEVYLIQHYVISVCLWLATGQWFSPGTPVSSTNKTGCHDITEILFKVMLNTINLSTLVR